MRGLYDLILANVVDLFLAIGVLLICYGARQIYKPAAPILLGFAMVALAVSAARPRRPRNGDE